MWNSFSMMKPTLNNLTHWCQVSLYLAMIPG